MPGYDNTNPFYNENPFEGPVTAPEAGINPVATQADNVSVNPAVTAAPAAPAAPLTTPSDSGTPAPVAVAPPIGEPLMRFRGQGGKFAPGKGGWLEGMKAMFSAGKFSPQELGAMRELFAAKVGPGAAPVTGQPPVAAGPPMSGGMPAGKIAVAQPPAANGIKQLPNGFARRGGFYKRSGLATV